MRHRLLLGLVLGLLAVAPALADTIHQKKVQVDQQIAGLRDRLAATKQKESALKDEIAAVTVKIRDLESKVGDVSGRLSTLEHELALRQQKLDGLNQLFRLETRRLVFLRVEYAHSLARLNRRLVDVYESDGPTTLDVLFSSASVSDIVMQLDYVKRIGAQDRRIALEVAAAKAEVAKARSRTRRARAGVAAEARVIAVRARQVQSVRDSLVASQNQLAADRGHKKQSLDSLSASERHDAEEIDALNAVSAQLAAQIKAAQEAARRAGSATATRAPGALAWPVNGPVESPFGWRWGRIHEGIDIAAATGTPVDAAASGTVIIAGVESGYGNLVAIDNGGGVATLYAHLSSIGVSVGEQVAKGQAIGAVGCTGHCFGPHVHFEVRVNGAAVDPLGYL